MYIDTCEAFYGDESYLSYLLPINRIDSIINQRLRELSDTFVGVHIRRGDNETSKQISTTELFLSAIAKQIENGSNCFYLSSDSTKEVELLKKEFGELIVHFPVGLKRNKPNDIQDALVGIMLLSKASLILGSYFSSFSEVAAAYGGVPLLTVGKQK